MESFSYILTYFQECFIIEFQQIIHKNDNSVELSDCKMSYVIGFTYL